MALSSADYYFERSLRCQPSDRRPKPLKRGQGVGGGNYRNLPQADGARRAAGNSVSGPRLRSDGRTGVAPAEPLPSNLKSGYCQPSAQNIRSKNVSNPKPLATSKNRSEAISFDPGTSTFRLSTSSTLGKRPAPEVYSQRKSVTTVPSKKVARSSAKSSLNCAPPRCAAPTGQASKSRTVSFDSPSMSSSNFKSSARPGPSCLRPPPVGKKRVKFSGLSCQERCPSPDRFSASSSSRRDDPCREPCEAGPSSTVSPQGPVHGPSLYPIYPDQYETPYVSLPGPKQILLMPGDIDPNETTIIDIVGLNEYDVQEVPGIPPAAPATLLRDAWKAYMKEAEAQDLKWRKQTGRLKDEKKAAASFRDKKKKEEKCKPPSFAHYNFIHEGRAFAYEEYGNVGVDDPKDPASRGPTSRAPDPECERARGFSYRSRKTTVRPFTEDERKEMEEAEVYRTIKALISDHDAKWERDRACRGLGDDDLIDIDAEDCVSRGNVVRAPADIFSRTDSCGFGKPVYPRSPQLSPIRESPPRPPDSSGSNVPSLIAWDESVSLTCPDDKSDVDIMTRTPPRCPQVRRDSASPDLMGMCEPDVDLIGLESPPRSRSRSPAARREKDDLIRWDSPVQGALPFDVQCDENLFDTVTRTSPSASLLVTPPLSSRGGKAGRDLTYREKPASDAKSCPRVVKAIPFGDDPNTVVLEGSPLARGSPKDNCNRYSPSEDTDDSLGILNYDSSFDFDDNSVNSSGMRGNYDVSGVAPLEDCPGEESELGILEIDKMVDFDFSVEEDRKVRAEAKYRLLFGPLIGGSQRLDQEKCQYDQEFEDLDLQFEQERADLLQLAHEPEYSPPRRRDNGKYGSELLSECKDPIERCADLLGLTEPAERKTPDKRCGGPYTRQLLEACPDEQQMIDIDEECPRQRTPRRPPEFNYSRDLFTNVQWDPSMARDGTKNCPP